MGCRKLNSPLVAERKELNGWDRVARSVSEFLYGPTKVWKSIRSNHIHLFENTLSHFGRLHNFKLNTFVSEPNFVYEFKNWNPRIVWVPLNNKLNLPVFKLILIDLKVFSEHGNELLTWACVVSCEVMEVHHVFCLINQIGFNKHVETTLKVFCFMVFVTRRYAV